MTFPLFNADYKSLMIRQLCWHILKKCLIPCERPLCRVVSSFGFGYSGVTNIIVYPRRRLYTCMAMLWATIQHSKLHLHSSSSKLDCSVQRNISWRAMHSTTQQTYQRGIAVVQPWWDYFKLIILGTMFSQHCLTHTRLSVTPHCRWRWRCCFTWVFEWQTTQLGT